MDSIRAAVVQAGSVDFDAAKCLEKALALIAEAASQGAQLIVFPEAFISGYPKGNDFGARVGSRTPEGHREFRRYYESAIDLDGPEAIALGEATRQHNVYLVIGVIEREGGTLYCTAIFFGPEGALGKHRKVMPTAMERLIWGYGDGSTLTVLDTEIGKLGAVICWENYMPLMRMAMYAKGIQLYCAPTVDDRETWASSMQHIAREGRCFVLSACQNTRTDHPIRGGSVIVNPMGRILAGPVYGEDAILIADLDLNEIIEAKFDFDVTGHYSRPDIFRLLVNEASAPAVVFEGDQED